VTNAPWHIDPLDPRAPSAEVWESLSPSERRKVLAALPSDVPLTSPPEGDPHRIPKVRAFEALEEHFRRIGRGVYLGSELPVYYPSERMFAPDIIAVLDVDPHERERWAVSHERRGLDFALEVTYSGDKKKDLELNVAWFARLGIPEYFVLDVRAARLHGYRLEPGESAYRPVLPQGGRWASRVLGLALALEGRRLRFYSGAAPLPESAELVRSLEQMMDDITQRKEDAERAREESDHAREQSERAREESDRAREESDRAREESDRAREEAERTRDKLAAKLRELGIDPDKL
jgi:hypothetical protein